MKCKNCQHTLESDAQFCDNCGAKVVKNRITLKFLLTEIFTNVFGLDNKFFLTIRKMITNPEDVLNEYLSGVRKRYVNPFTIFAIGAGISLLVFNFFADEYLAINQKNQFGNPDEINQLIIPGYDKMPIEKKQELIKNQEETQEKTMKFILSYFNIFSFLLLPVYAFMAFLTYRKPHNYGEHIVINAYIQSVTFFITTFGFLLSLLVSPSFFAIAIVCNILFYLYVYHRLYNLTIPKSIVKLLKFIVIATITMIVFLLLSFAIGVLVSIINRLF